MSKQNSVWKDGRWRLTLDPYQRSEVDAIRDDALEVGWTMDELYGNSSSLPFPYGNEWGLAAHLVSEADMNGESSTMDKIVSVNDKYIEIKSVKTFNRVLVSDPVSRFYRQ